MDKKETRALLEQVAEGKLTVDEAVLRLKRQPFEDCLLYTSRCV